MGWDEDQEQDGFVTFRHFLSWKSLYYDVLLPGLRLAGPDRADRVLAALGHGLAAAWPARRSDLTTALERARLALDADWDLVAVRRELEVGILRFQARDYLLDGLDDGAFFDRFDVHGAEHLASARGEGRGVILVAAHFGNYAASMQWVFRRGIPFRLLLERMQHCSRYLNSQYDIATGPCPQSGFFLRRNMPPEVAAQRIFRTRTALREGMAVYLKGDVPWNGANTRPGKFLGHVRPFQSLWAEFAARFRAPVVPIFCTHLPAGRFRLTFDAPWNVSKGEEGSAVTRYLARVEDEIRAHPAEAVAHLLWNCYGDPTDPELALSKRGGHGRPKRSIARVTRSISTA
jgi:lauroyl/myristoyl acyltransferase